MEFFANHFGIHHLMLFISSAIIFVLTPGIDTVFVLNRTLQNGQIAGVLSALGVATGVLVHTLFATLGLASILAKSATAFMLIKYLGAMYLIYLGIMAIKNSLNVKNYQLNSQDNPKSAKNAYLMGLLTNVLNPKVALFFLAFFPQFIQKDALANATPYLFLGGLYAVISVTWLVLLAIIGAMFIQFLQSVKARRSMDGISGVAFIGLGAKLGFSESS